MHVCIANYVWVLTQLQYSNISIYALPSWRPEALWDWDSDGYRMLLLATSTGQGKFRFVTIII